MKLCSSDHKMAALLFLFNTELAVTHIHIHVHSHTGKKESYHSEQEKKAENIREREAKGSKVWKVDCCLFSIAYRQLHVKP